MLAICIGKDSELIVEFSRQLVSGHCELKIYNIVSYQPSKGVKNFFFKGFLQILYCFGKGFKQELIQSCFTTKPDFIPVVF